MAKKGKAAPVKKSHYSAFFVIGALVVLVTVLLLVKASFGAKEIASSQGGNIIITKSAVAETAKFIPYQVGNTKMEVLAVRAPDGSIRTAFNTCQVCYNSGRGYYKQVGDELVCQNCGNRFKASAVEQEIGGCNPVPILEANKTDDGTTITIPQNFLEKNKGLFGKWKKA